MQNRFDELAKVLAEGGSRRQALRLVGAGLIGGALATLGIGTASAQTAPPLTPECRRCINQYYGQCLVYCTHTSSDPSTCAQTCFTASREFCTVLGECT